MKIRLIFPLLFILASKIASAQEWMFFEKGKTEGLLWNYYDLFAFDTSSGVWPLHFFKDPREVRLNEKSG